MVDLLDWARRFIATPSVSRDGNGRIAALAAELLATLGIDARIETAAIDGVTHHAVIADLGPADAPDGLLLLTHLDTVPPGDPAAWTATGGDPFRPTLDGSRLYGLGSADAKVDFVCKAAALERLQRSKLRRRIRIVGSFAEEIGLLGARWLIDQGATRGLRWALVGEPSELAAIHAHKGYATFDAEVHCDPLPSVSGRRTQCEVRGTSAHSSTPDLGRNAIQIVLDRLAEPDVQGVIHVTGGEAVNKVPDLCTAELLLDGPGDAARPAVSAKPLLEFHRGWRGLLARLESRRDDAFDPSHGVANLGRIERRDDSFRIGFDLRPVPGSDPLEEVRLLEPFAEITCARQNPALGGDPDSLLVRSVVSAQRDLGLPQRVGTKATCTEAGLLAAAGVRAVVLGAGRSVGNVHRPNEYTWVPQLEQARDLYSNVLQRLCLSPTAPGGSGGA